MTECYECAKLAELVAENSQLRVKVDELAEVLDLKQELVDELPGRDALTLMRMGFGEMLDALGIDRNEKGHCTKAIHTLADMVERDYVRREEYVALGKSLGLAQAERDEWRFKAEQLANDALPDENGVSDPDGGSNVAYIAQDTREKPWHERVDDYLATFDDSREKLEADVRKNLAIMKLEGYVFDMIHGWLDRQAAITERHWMEIVGASANANVELKRQIDERQARVDELTEQLESAHAKKRSLKAHIAKMQEGRHGWHVKYPELEKKNAELEAERDQWREASGNAHDMWEEADAERNELRREVYKLARENISLARDLGECMAERDALVAEIDALEYQGELDEPRGTLVDMDGEAVG